MGAYCLLGLIPSHPARVGEIMKVLWSSYHEALIFGDRREIACIPHTGCRLEIVATPHLAPQGQLSLARTGHPVQALVLPRRSVRVAGRQ